MTSTVTRPEPDIFGRCWPGVSEEERCRQCGQPDNCGDCTHGQLSDAEATQLGAHTNPACFAAGECTLLTEHGFFVKGELALEELLADAKAHELSARSVWYSEEAYWEDALEALTDEDAAALEALAEALVCPHCDGTEFKAGIFQRVEFDVRAEPDGMKVTAFRLDRDFDGSWQVCCAGCGEYIEGSGFLYRAPEDADRLYEAVIDATNKVPTQKYERALT